MDFKRLVLSFVLLLGVSGCDGVEDVYSFAEWREVLKGNGRWHIVKVPDSKLVPGSIVKITKEDGLTWIDSLESCGIPAGLLDGKPDEGGDNDVAELVQLGASPSISFERAAEFSANVMLNVSGVKAGPEFSKIAKVVLSIGENGGDAIRLIRLTTWIRENQNSFKDVCLEEFAKEDRYLVAESFRFSSATYSFFDQNGAKLELTVPQLGQIFKFEPSAKFSLTAQGELRIDQPMYVAVRQAIRTEGSFDTLSSDPGSQAAAADEIPATGDEILEAHNLAAQ